MNELVLRDFGGVPEITQEASRLKREALQAARPIARVTTPEEQAQAVAVLQKLKDVRTGLEESRKAVKRPVLDLGKKIDEIARSFGEEIEKQYGRISGMINHYQRKLLREQNEEVDRNRDREAAVAALRRQADALRNTGNDKEAERFEAEAFDLEMSNEIASAPVVIDKPKGLVVKNRINFQVIDAIVFAQAWPQFWKWNAETETLKLDRMRILDELNREDMKGPFHMTRFPEELSQTEDRRLVQPAGLRVFEETRTHVR